VRWCRQGFDEWGAADEEIRAGIRNVEVGRLVPINFVDSARHNPRFEPDLEAKFFECFAGREEVPGRRGFALRDALTGSQPHGGTELGNAISSLPASDRLIVITDEQSHDKMPQRKGCLINVASAQNGVGYGQWVNIDGWSDQVLDYIIKYEASD
jgi:60 kDa SS-A/Ro ribonucleoprotein